MARSIGPRAAAVAAPVLCALHCLAAPVLAVLAPALAENAGVEVALVGATLATGANAGRGGVALHGDGRLWLLVVLASLLFAAKAAAGHSDAIELAVTVLGSMCIVAALAWDARLRRRCACCAHVPTDRGHGESIAVEAVDA